jgi:hypothetical protein
MWYQSPEDVILLGALPQWSVVRLPDSRYRDWETGHEFFPHFTEYAEDLLVVLKEFYALGFRTFQLDNEADLTWLPHGMTCWDWATFMRDVLEYIEDDVPSDVILLFTPLSVSAAKSEWLRAASALNLPRHFKGVAVHCYWQAGGDLYADWAGGAFLWWGRATGLPVYVTEAGNSSIQRRPPLPTMQEIEQKQVTEYPLYERYCRNGGVVALYFYILGSNGDWRGFELAERACLELGKRQRRTNNSGGPSQPKTL